MRDQGCFELGARPETSQLARAGDNAVSGYEKRNRVVVKRPAHRARGLGMPGLPGHPAVRARLTVGNFLCRSKNIAGE